MLKFFNKKIKILLISAITVIFSINGGSSTLAGTQDDIAAKSKQIEEIQKQIEEYQQQIDQNRSKSITLETEIKSLNSKISQLTLEIRSLGYSIEQTGLEIKYTEERITDAEQRLDKHKSALVQYLRLAYQIDNKSLAAILIKNNTLSDFFNDVNNIQISQENLQATIDNIKDIKNDLGDQKDNLESKKSDQLRLKSLQEIEKKSLDGNKQKKNQILRETKGQESKFQELVKKSKLDIERIRSQITYLQQNGISAEDAVKYAQLAAIAVGIRPAFLLALLEIESKLGQNVGTGNWSDDMYQCYLRLSKIARTPERKQFYVSRAETEKNAFFAIIGKLGLNADSVKVSREPNYGCGGALGPAQFIPSTWLSYEGEVLRVTGHEAANPWSAEDAFTASAIKLARGGATSKDRTGETRAAKAYIGGSPTCSSSICNYYAKAVLQKAAEIEQNL